MDKIFEQIPEIFETQLAQIADISKRIWLRGWAEANAGNISMRISAGLKQHKVIESHDDREYYLVSRGGSRYRQMETDPLSQMLLVRTEGKTEDYFPHNAKPTSEWQAHHGLQQRFLREKPDTVVVLHAHPLEVIALSQVLSGKAFSSEMTRVLAELKLYLPEGIAFCPSAPPGSNELAELSCKNLKQEKALVWQSHGLLCFGNNPDEAFDYMEIICKAAALYLLINR